MQKIGEGYYYNVFEVEDGKVLKKVKNKLRIFLFILSSNKFNLPEAIGEYRNMNSLSKLKDDYVKIMALVSDKEIIGNPHFVDAINYTQDKVESLRNAKHLDQQAFSQLVDDYSSLVKKFWSFGMSDIVFNFTINCGYNKNKRLILFDFNEMTFDVEDIMRHIKNKIWLQRASYVSLDADKKKVFRELMEREITQENVEKYWNTNT